MKEKILDMARQLYNDHGLSAVTARIICDRLKISLGSYSYHFPDKKNILIDLYNEMLLEIQAIYTSMQTTEPDILTYLDSHRLLFLLQEKYKFFYMNLFEILTNQPEIMHTHKQKRSEEMAMAKQIFLYYMQKGILKTNISESQIERLIHVGEILNNYWPIDAAVSADREESDRLIHYMKICCGLLEPYLESESHMAYNDYFKRFEK